MQHHPTLSYVIRSHTTAGTPAMHGVSLRTDVDNVQLQWRAYADRRGRERKRHDCTPGMFTVARHIRGRCVCAECETLIQVSSPAQIIDKTIPTAGLLDHVLVAKCADDL